MAERDGALCSGVLACHQVEGIIPHGPPFFSRVVRNNSGVDSGRWPVRRSEVGDRKWGGMESGARSVSEMFWEVDEIAAGARKVGTFRAGSREVLVRGNCGEIATSFGG
jgi:hypothetical protein